MGLSVSGVSHGNAAAGSAVSVQALPTGASVGDLLLAEVTVTNATVSVTAGQTGWAAVPNGSTLTGGNSQAGCHLYYRFASGSDPTNWTFTPSDGATLNASITAITGGADPTTPFLCNIVNIATSGVTQTTSYLVPMLYGCLPLAFFGAGNSANGALSGFASGWSQTYVEDKDTSTNSQYHATQGQVGPLTTDTSTQITATTTWAQYTTTYGFAAILLVQPAQPGAITTTPATGNIAIAGLGTANAVQVTVNQTNWTGTTTITVVSGTPGSISVSATQNGTYGSSVTLTGANPTFWAQQLTPGTFEFTVVGG